MWCHHVGKVYLKVWIQTTNRRWTTTTTKNENSGKAYFFFNATDFNFSQLISIFHHSFHFILPFNLSKHLLKKHTLPLALSFDYIYKPGKVLFRYHRKMLKWIFILLLLLLLFREMDSERWIEWERKRMSIILPKWALWKLQEKKNWVKEIIHEKNEKKNLLQALGPLDGFVSNCMLEVCVFVCIMIDVWQWRLLIFGLGLPMSSHLTTLSTKFLRSMKKVSTKREPFNQKG